MRQRINYQTITTQSYRKVIQTKKYLKAISSSHIPPEVDQYLPQKTSKETNNNFSIPRFYFTNG